MKEPCNSKYVGKQLHNISRKYFPSGLLQRSQSRHKQGKVERSSASHLGTLPDRAASLDGVWVLSSRPSAWGQGSLHAIWPAPGCLCCSCGRSSSSSSTSSLPGLSFPRPSLSLSLSSPKMSSTYFKTKWVLGERFRRVTTTSASTFTSVFAMASGLILRLRSITLSLPNIYGYYMFNKTEQNHNVTTVARNLLHNNNASNH